MSLPKYWKTREGKRLKISEMETSHIQNCIKMLKRKGFTTVAKRKQVQLQMDLLECLRAQDSLRGEMAIFSMEQEENRIWYETERIRDNPTAYEKRKYPRLKALEQELYKRQQNENNI